MDEEEVELWGFHAGDVEGVRAVVERSLGVTFELLESESIGPYYFASLCAPHAELTLRPNLDAAFDEDSGEDPDDALAEPDFPDYGVLLYIDWHTRGHACREKAQGLGAEAQLLLVE
ncbi:MAG TPA: hypothetical protein VKF32_04050 [Thermoanaerobaculia bacterium]|nr:hypothetical protein [Thermoanaerobaculia bacterium]